MGLRARLPIVLGSRRSAGLLWLAVFGAAAAIALFVIQPLGVFAAGSDTASTVVYWDRIAAGQRLEAFVGTTPKPLLSVVYGPLFGVFGDWRAIGLMAVAVYAAGIATASVLVERLTGSTVAAVFVAVGFIASWQLFQDVSLAYAVSWLLLTTALAGMCVTAATPRYGWAGLILLVGALARQEALFVTGLGLVVVAGAVIARRARPEREPVAGRPRLLAIGLLAVPLTAVHDWVLTGDPGYSLKVQTLGVAGRATRGLDGTIDFVVHHLVQSWPMVLLAVVGLGLALYRRQWVIAVALIALGPLVVGLVLFVGWRDLIVLERYLLPVDLALILGAGVSIAVVADRLRAFLPERGLRLGPPIAIGVAVALALALSPRIGPLDGTLRARLELERQATADLAVLQPAIERALAAVPRVRDRPPAVHPLTRPIDRAVLVVPARFVPTLAAQLRLPLDRIAFLDADMLAAASPDPGPDPGSGWIVWYQRGFSAPESAFVVLETTSPAVVGRLAVEPIQSIDTRAWLLTVRRVQ
jgi:hypothetical protein